MVYIKNISALRVDNIWPLCAAGGDVEVTQGWHTGQTTPGGWHTSVLTSYDAARRCLHRTDDDTNTDRFLLGKQCDTTCFTNDNNIIDDK